MHLQFFVSLLLFLSTNAKETPQQKAERMQLASQADIKIASFKHGNLIPHENIASFLKSGTKLLFFGAVWCKFTQKFKPKYVEAIQLLEKSNVFSDVEIKYVECSVNESFCLNQYKVTEGYPTIFLYKDNVLIEEYPYADETKEFVDYVMNIRDKVRISKSQSLKKSIDSKKTVPETKIVSPPVEKESTEIKLNDDVHISPPPTPPTRPLFLQETIPEKRIENTNSIIYLGLIIGAVLIGSFLIKRSFGNVKFFKRNSSYAPVMKNENLLD